MAMAYNAALYSKKICTSIEELKSTHQTKATKDEIVALKRKNTREKIKLPKENKTIGCKQVFTINYKGDRKIKMYKVRLMAKGYTHTYGIYYAKTFSPVVKIDTIRDLFLVAANKEWSLH